jgi:site-specific recombinase
MSVFSRLIGIFVGLGLGRAAVAAGAGAAGGCVIIFSVVSIVSKISNVLLKKFRSSLFLGRRYKVNFLGIGIGNSYW